MPRLSDSMQEGTILTWLKGDGDQVAAGDELVEIETDKATMTYESPGAGVLEIVAAAGSTLAVDEPIARLGSVAHGPPTVTVPGSNGASPPSAPVAAGTTTATLVPATPLARRVAADHGIDLASVTGTGPHGRVTRRDVVSAGSLDVASPVPPPGAPRSQPDGSASGSEPAAARSAGAARPQGPAGVSPAVDGARGEIARQELTRIQQVIARRMAETKATVPDFQVQTDVAVDALLALRGQLKAETEHAPSVNDFIVKAAALALREFPLVNGSYRDGGFELHSRVNVGVAVAAENALIVPTVTDADTRSVGSIAREVRRLADAVRAGTVTAGDLAGATFTVSNLGMYGMSAITPVINAPQAAILGVGAARPVLARVNGEIVDRQLMTLTLSADHRILYGAEASRFLSRVRELLEQPLQLAF